jgi:hypothetical protein
MQFQNSSFAFNLTPCRLLHVSYVWYSARASAVKTVIESALQFLVSYKRTALLGWSSVPKAAPSIRIMLFFRVACSIRAQ